jgi:hypothetical protein
VADTTRITVTLPKEQVADDVSGYVAEAVARRLRRHLRGADLLRYQEEHGKFTDEKLAEARAGISGTASGGPAGAA